jgi:hypothetical protein
MKTFKALGTFALYRAYPDRSAKPIPGSPSRSKTVKAWLITEAASVRFPKDIVVSFVSG